MSSPARSRHPRSPKTATATRLPVIGWREWIALPEFGVARVKAKVDTGARSSSLHAFSLKSFRRDGAAWVRFQIHPVQRSTAASVDVEAPVLEFRQIRSSNGKSSRRPVIVTPIELMGWTWPIELTLASRDEMGFRMLLGREAIRNRFLVHTGRSFLARKASQTPPDPPLAT
jgi:hypothetical protein